MNQEFNRLYSKSLALLQELTTSEGLLASTIEADNYKRIWARDSMVCGLAGIWANDGTVINGLKESLLTLARYQHETGMIPSNVLPKHDDVSFGSLVGRIDANTWFIIGACLYFQHTKDEQTWENLLPHLQQCRRYLKACEFNNKGWIYTPLSGNWADEYPIHGYTLYDNTLRIWGEQLWDELAGDSISQTEQLSEKTRQNFWPLKNTDAKIIYQDAPYREALEQGVSHFGAFILPGLYDMRFDAAANALALVLFELQLEQKQELVRYIDYLESHLRLPVIPAFWPLIDEHSEDWYLLKGNHSFSFKNNPGDFHNGGIWPVWMGLFCYGLAHQGMHDQVQRVVVAFMDAVDKNPSWDFEEFFNARTLQVGGKNQMGYSASGIVFMKKALDLASE